MRAAVGARLVVVGSTDFAVQQVDADSDARSDRGILDVRSCYACYPHEQTWVCELPDHGK